MAKPSRRNALWSAPAALAATGTLVLGNAPAPDNRLVRENTKPGTTDWQLTYVKFDGKERFRSRLIEGYCSRTSVRPGQKITFHISTEPAARTRIEIFRMGYYQGKGARHMTTLGPFSTSSQNTPNRGPKRLRECGWQPSIDLEVPEEWPGGVYLGKLTCDSHRFQSYVTFTVVEERKSDLLFQCSTNTWQAYNKWPLADSLYDNDHPSKKPLVSGVRVSFNRPYAKYPQVVDHPLSIGSGEFLLWEFPFAYWLEGKGYDVNYCANEDVHTGGPDFIARAKAFLSVGHDEYWTRRQYDACMEAVRRGVNFGFFSGNSVCFVVDDAVPRQLERLGRFGGIRPGEEKYMEDLPVQAPNESTLIGAQTVSPFNGSGDWTCANPAHWLFEGTGMKKGDAIPGLVGWEFHGDPADIPGLEVVAKGTTINSGSQPSHYEATIYPGPKGNTVFNASTIFWAMGLASPPGHILPFVHDGRPHGPDPRVERITENVLKRWLAGK